LRKFGKRIRTWNHLSFEKKKVFLTAAACLLSIKFGLSLLPFPAFRRIYRWLSTSGTSREVSTHEINQTVWAVDTAANVLPLELLCLPRALATKYLLRGATSLTLEIGVEVNPAKAFEAHAWVEQNGNIIIGSWPETMTYQRLWVWQ
jgi:hypothetical protein